MNKSQNILNITFRGHSVNNTFKRIEKNTDLKSTRSLMNKLYYSILKLVFTNLKASFLSIHSIQHEQMQNFDVPADLRTNLVTDFDQI